MAIANRYDFLLLFDVKDGNPNGDPDAGNLPRTDAETGLGLVTDVCIKRKIRNYVELAKPEAETDGSSNAAYKIYVREKGILDKQHERAYIAIGAEDVLSGKEDKKRKGTEDAEKKAKAWMCANFFDVRTFGAVMSTGVNCGQVRGPVQITFARSVDPIVAAEHTITRMAVTTENEAAKQGGDNRTMGRKYTVPYGLYVAQGYISAHLAKQAGFSEADLALLFESLQNMFEHDHSAARGQMATRGLYVFKHDSELGNAPAHALFKRIHIHKKDGVDVARSFEDYAVELNQANLPSGVSLLDLSYKG
jgi:CRISPR-associated protein Csd2